MSSLKAVDCSKKEVERQRKENMNGTLNVLVNDDDNKNECQHLRARLCAALRV